MRGTLSRSGAVRDVDELDPTKNLSRSSGLRGSMLPGPGSTFHSPDGYEFSELYILGEKLGSGSYGDVYRCMHKDKSFQDKQYAVKNLDKVRLAEQSSSNIYREISILRELSHVPHIVTLVDKFEDHRNIWMVQTLADGGDVFDRLGQRRRPYTEKDARDLARILLQTILEIHKVPVVHRDLKPENLLLESPHDDTSIILADFGFARHIHPNDPCQTRCGTPAFVAPEILLGVPYGTSVDLWSIGCLLYMLLSGYPPFQGNNHRELFCKVRAGDFVFHESSFNEVSTEAKTLISNLLTVNPQTRWAAHEALQSEWFKIPDKKLQQNDLSSRALVGFVKMSKERRARNNWKKLGKAIIWAANQPFFNKDLVTFNSQISTWDQHAIANQMEEDEPSEAPSRMMTREGTIRIPNAPYERMIVNCVRFHDMYRITSTLRTGSAAEVHLCQHKHTQETYAVKIVNRKQLTPQDDENVLTEVASMQALSANKYCVQLLDFYEEPDYFFLIMEYMDGGDVFERIVHLKSYTEKDARDLTAILLKAVKSIHASGIAHRDIKPQNLLLKTRENHTSVKIGDCGFSRRVHTPNSLTSRVGTPTYVAPEILKNIPHDQRVDLWSIGVVVYVLLVGYPPFLEDDQALLFDKIRMGQWEFVEEDWSHISNDAKMLIQGLLQVDPKDRWSVDQALRCRWISNRNISALSGISLRRSVSSIRMKRRRLRTMGHSVRWTGIDGDDFNEMPHTAAQPMDILNEDAERDPMNSFGSFDSLGLDPMDFDD